MRCLSSYDDYIIKGCYEIKLLILATACHEIKRRKKNALVNKDAAAFYSVNIIVWNAPLKEVRVE